MKGRILVISGPSGVGKSTVCRRLERELPAEFSISVTTRKSRAGEVDGRDYKFVDAATFEVMRENGGLAEFAEVYGQKYGTPIAPVTAAVREGRTIILEIDINGAIQVRRVFPQAVMVFMLPPNSQEQARRIIDRRTDSETEIAKRLAHADGEIRYANESGVYNKFIINDDVAETVATIKALLGEEHGE